MFEVIPAIDILGGKCVRLEQGEFNAVTVYGSDPVAMARAFADKGARRLHVVDLDGARTGIAKNLESIKKIIQAVKIPVQVGGGIRNLRVIDEVLAAGADRIVLGTSAIDNPNILSNFCPKYGEKVAIAVDVKNGKVTTHGWKKTSPLDALTLAKEAVKLGVRRIIYTDIKRDGMLTGPNFDAIQEMAEVCLVPVIASGGVSSKADVLRLKEMYPLGVEGVIVGKALYAGSVNLEEIL